MTRNWSPCDALLDMLMRHLYVWAPGEAEARCIIEEMTDEMLRDVEEAGYALVPVEPTASMSEGQNRRRDWVH